ncbi:hypothetical protein ENBRE01_1149 [Enteropsectra breve]|nr:hypothetical protein ENBRE01_1149 [Enteropsectra breve]
MHWFFKFFQKYFSEMVIVISASLLLVICLMLLSSYFYSSYSSHFENISTFILSNTELKAYLLGSLSCNNIETQALRAMIKINERNINYSDLSEEEKQAIKITDFSILYGSRGANFYDMCGKFEFLLKQVLDSGNAFSTACKDIFVTCRESFYCPSTNQTNVSSVEKLMLKTDLNASDIDEAGVARLRISDASEKQPCSQCNTNSHEETHTFSIDEIKHYFILKLVASPNINRNTVTFASQNCIESDKGINLLPNAYEIVSILYVENNQFSRGNMSVTLNKGLPMVFNNVKEGDSYYLMMKLL